MSRSLYARLYRRFGPKDQGISRREMLRRAGMASGGLLLSGFPASVIAALQAANKKRVVVIGGGFSGLSCAFELKSAGYDVTVVEARNRVGGRVLSFSDFVSNRNVEGGGELIGSNHPTWVQYAQKFGLEFLDVTEDENLEFPLMFDGKLVSAEEAEKLFEEMTTAFDSMTADAAEINADEPWLSTKAAELDKRSLADWVAGLTISDLGRKAVTVQLTADNAVSADKQSYLAMLTAVKGGGMEKYWSDSEVYRCKGGNQQLAKILAESIGPDRIVLKLAVTEVDARNNIVKVKCADGRTIEADDVVLAAPPSLWDKIKFNPGLPGNLKPQLGTAVKYLAALKTRFWKAKGLAPDMMTDGRVSMTWDATDNQEGDDNVALVGFSGGPAAQACLDIPKDKIDAEYKAEIGKIYEDFAANWTAARFMDWPRDPLTMAGYSFPAPGEVTTVQKSLYQGMGRLHFAGEHACVKFAGYMEGALNSGASLAKRIAKRDGVVSSTPS